MAQEYYKNEDEIHTSKEKKYRYLGFPKRGVQHGHKHVPTSSAASKMLDQVWSNLGNHLGAKIDSKINPKIVSKLAGLPWSLRGPAN